MKAKYQNLLYTIGSLALGIFLGFFIYAQMVFIPLAAIFTIVFLITLIFEKLKRTSEYKKYIKPLLFTLLAVLVSFFTTKLIEYDIINKRDGVIENIYAYRAVHNKFPTDLDGFGTPSKKYHYSVDSSLSNFEIVFRGMYGFPNSFKSKDSIWTVP